MTEHLLAAYRADFEARSRDRRLYTVGAFPEGHGVNAHEIRPGVVYKDANVRVTAFATKHAMESYGYRFETADRSIVISGDTNPTQATIDACSGCDVLIHEVLTLEWLAKRPDFRLRRAASHDDGPARGARGQGQAPPAHSVSRLAVAPTGRGCRAVDTRRAAARDGCVPGTGRRRPRPGRVLTMSISTFESSKKRSNRPEAHATAGPVAGGPMGNGGR